MPSLVRQSLQRGQPTWFILRSDNLRMRVVGLEFVGRIEAPNDLDMCCYRKRVAGGVCSWMIKQASSGSVRLYEGGDALRQLT